MSIGRRGTGLLLLDGVLRSARVPLSALPELARLLTGSQPAVRLRLGERAATAVLAVARRQGVPAAACVPAGAPWDTRLPGGDRGLVVIASAPGLPERLCDAERDAAWDDAAALLGYPPCCVAAFERLRAAGPQAWVRPLLAASGPGPHLCWANRFAPEWGGTCPAGELVPCRLDCPEAVELGRRGIAALHDLRLAHLAATLLAQAHVPVAIDSSGHVRRLVPGERAPRGWDAVRFSA
jgi:hypothetical protein